jgi:hypothetical protein
VPASKPAKPNGGFSFKTVGSGGSLTVAASARTPYGIVSTHLKKCNFAQPRMRCRNALVRDARFICLSHLLCSFRLSACLVQNLDLWTPLFFSSPSPALGLQSTTPRAIPSISAQATWYATSQFCLHSHHILVICVAQRPRNSDTDDCVCYDAGHVMTTYVHASLAFDSHVSACALSSFLFFWSFSYMQKFHILVNVVDLMEPGNEYVMLLRHPDVWCGVAFSWSSFGIAVSCSDIIPDCPTPSDVADFGDGERQAFGNALVGHYFTADVSGIHVQTAETERYHSCCPNPTSDPSLPFPTALR